MRLGIVLDQFRPQRGGTERYLAEFARRLAARNHDVRIYCLDGETPAPGVTLVRIAPQGRTRAARERAFADAACAKARADGCAPLLGIRHVLDVDVYQPHGGTWAATVAARLASERTSWRRVLRQALHRFSPKQRYFEHADRAVFARRRGLLTLAVSPLVRDDLLARYGEHAPRVEVVYPAIDRERIGSFATPAVRARMRRSLDVPEGAMLMAFVAHDFELKGLATAIEALSLRKASGSRLVVIGRDRPAPYQRLAARLGVDSAVRFIGARHDVPELLASADVLVQPTHHDPCALATLESLAAGTPVVTTRWNGASALLEGGAGRVVDAADDAKSLAEAIDAVLAEGAQARAAASEAARSLGWGEHLARIVPLLEQGWRAGTRA